MTRDDINSPRHGERVTCIPRGEGNTYYGEDGRPLHGMEGPFADGLVQVGHSLYWRPITYTADGRRLIIVPDSLWLEFTEALRRAGIELNDYHAIRSAS